MVCSEVLAGAVDRRYVDRPDFTVRIKRERNELAAHQDLSAALANLARGCLPHHARTFARVFEALDQGLDDRASRLAGRRSDVERAPQGIGDGHAEIEPLDSLGCPIRGD